MINTIFKTKNTKIDVRKTHIEFFIDPPDYDCYTVSMDLAEIDLVIKNLLAARSVFTEQLLNTEILSLHGEYNKQQLTIVQLRHEIFLLKNTKEQL